MKINTVLISGLLLFIASGCGPVEKMFRHDFDSGYYKLKKDSSDPANVYAKIKEDSIFVYPTIIAGRKKVPDTNSVFTTEISKIKPGNSLYKSTFVGNSPDVDLTTILLKLRPHKSDVPTQLSYNVNAAIYCGFRKDYYKLITHKSPLNEMSSSVIQVGFDFGLFAGVGITPVNPSVTEFNQLLEYDGIVLQKGFAGFITFDNISLGLAVGFDNLMDKNKNIWIYNNKPYFGLVIGISNF